MQPGPRRIVTALRIPPRPVVFAGLATAFSLLGDQALYVLLPLYFEKIGLVPIQVGILLSANRWIRLYTNHLAHRLLERLPARWLLITALLLGSLLSLVYASSTSFIVLLTARCLWGLSWSFIRHVNVMTVRRDAAQGALAQMMGYYNGLARLGSVVGIVMGGVLFDLLGFAATLTLFALLSLLALPFASTAQDVSTSARGQTKEQDRLPTALLACGFTVGSVGPGLVMSTLGFVLVNRIGSQLDIGGQLVGVATLTGLLLGVRWVLDAFAAPMFGHFVDRVGAGTAVPLLFGAGTAALVGLYALPGLAPLLIGIVAFFVCGTALYTALAAEASRLGSSTFARFATASDLGSAFGPLIGWAAFEFVASPSMAFVLGAVLYGTGVVAALMDRRRRQYAAVTVATKPGGW